MNSTLNCRCNGCSHSCKNKTDGPVHEHIGRAFRSYQPFAALRGTLEYEMALERDAEVLKPHGFSPDDYFFSDRYPGNEESFVDESLARLRDARIIPATDYPKREFIAWRTVMETSWDHAGRKTYIAGEESQLMFALCHILKPKTAVFYGSYFGYWAAWALPALRAHGGHAVLVDVDPTVCELARKNLHQMGFSSVAEVVNEDAIQFLRRTSLVHDFGVLDAELPEDHPDGKLAGKGIYGPIADAAADLIVPGGILMAHNVLTAGTHRSPFFEPRIARSYRQLAGFLAIMKSGFRRSVELESTEGIGVFMKSY